MVKKTPPEILNQENEDSSQFSEMAKLLKARLQFAQMKMKTGLSTEDLQHMEPAFISSPRQPRRPLPSEYPPTPSSSSPHSRRMKRLLLSAMTPTHNSWRKKKRIREQKQHEAILDEDAARTILMLKQHQPHTPPSSEHTQEKQYYSETHEDHYYDQETSDSDDQQDLFTYTDSIPNYRKKSEAIGRQLPRIIEPPPPPAIDPTLQLFQYNRPLPPPPMYGRPLSEDPFNSTPLTRNNASNQSPLPISPPSPTSPNDN